ncbi:MAG: carboxypeptidase, partial [Deltaproteobacteria bacterium]|nr:carboxypeptidase [Deltaproteobacteria bacterium]
MRLQLSMILLLILTGFLPVVAAEIEPEKILPPPHPWDGASRTLIAPEDHSWQTPSEATGFKSTPSYEETMVWLRELVEASPNLKLFTIGRSLEGRDILMVLASEKGRAPQENDRPLVLAQAGIHGGEIDGKDAGLMLLRDLAFGEPTTLLQKVDFL